MGRGAGYQPVKLPPEKIPQGPPPTDPRNREKEIVAMALDLIEEQIKAGTVSATVLTHFLKLASEREMVELAAIEERKRYATAKINAIEANHDLKDLYVEAMEAMKRYSGSVEGTSDGP